MQSSVAQELAKASGGGSWSLAYEHIISVENLLDAWQEFVKGKRNRKDVQEFARYLMSNILALHQDLISGRYRHGGYEHFRINDPKQREIHKANVRDRLVHHALHRKLYPFFDQTFIFDSYSCREGKGTHKALDRFRRYATWASGVSNETVWVLKCDIRKFFASIDQETLIALLERKLPDARTVALLQNIIQSFYSTTPGKGLPLGNLTSQLLVNIYMNEFDQFVKDELKARYYIRYSDDFVILSRNHAHLFSLLPRIQDFLHEHLMLQLHPDKVFIKTLASGVDFLGWVHFPDHRVLRTATKQRMLRAMSGNPSEATVASYLGMLSHGNAHKLSRSALSSAANLS